MQHCTTLKKLQLIHSFETEFGSNGAYFGDGWIIELQNNKYLLKSIEHIQFYLANSADVTMFFKLLGKVVNLKKLELKMFYRNLTKAEISSLKISFKNGLKHLKDITLFLKDDDGKEIEVKELREVL